jgi:hypothetical protein
MAPSYRRGVTSEVKAEEGKGRGAKGNGLEPGTGQRARGTQIFMGKGLGGKRHPGTKKASKVKRPPKFVECLVLGTGLAVWGEKAWVKQAGNATQAIGWL